MADEGGLITRQEGPTIIHERTDSNGILDDLFKNARNPRVETAVPLRQRNLPPSFFIPPNGVSKEFDGVGHTTGYLHVRSRSSPASINQTLSIAPEVNLSSSPYPGQEHHPATATHYRQKSVPAPQTSHQHLQLYNPVNVNQHYKVGHLLDGRIVFQNRVTNEVYPDSPGVRDQILGPLPDHWAAQNTSPADRGEVYYVDHSNQTTTWFDPRLPKDLQEPFVHSRHQQNQALQSQLQQQQLTNNRGMSSQQRPLSLAPVTQGQAPHSMLHQLQQHQVNFLPPGQGIYTGSTRSVPAALPQQPPVQQTVQQQQTRVHELELERKKMRLRQEEIQKQLFNQQATFGEQGAQNPQTFGVQENIMRRQLNDGGQMRDDYMGSPISPLANIRASDPFLYHGRQESDDSGFSPSTRHTPENFLAQNMEDLSIYANPSEPWQADQSMDVGTTDNMPGAQQVDQIMSDGQNELSDIYFSDIESVLRNDKVDPYATVTWL